MENRSGAVSACESIGDPVEERRDAIWSVPGDWRDTYFILFMVQAITCLGLVIWYEVFVKGPSGHFVAVLLTVFRDMAPAIVTIAAENVIIVEVLRMLSEKYLARRYKQGIEQGQALEKKKWEEWIKQLIESGKLPADVALPSTDSDKNGKET